MGFCNTAAGAADEADWVWGACGDGGDGEVLEEGSAASVDVDFDDLWHAVRGGGGGSYGVVTAVHYQLHALWDLKLVTVDPLRQARLMPVFEGLSAADQARFEELWYDFYIDFLFQVMRDDIMARKNKIGVSTTVDS